MRKPKKLLQRSSAFLCLALAATSAQAQFTPPPNNSEDAFHLLNDLLLEQVDVVINGGQLSISPFLPPFQFEASAPGSIERATGLRFFQRYHIGQMTGIMDDRSVFAPTIDRCPGGPGPICKFGFDNPDSTYTGVGPFGGGAFLYHFG